ncbi:MAG: 50S ribosomal protein L18 [Candidatus Omnitrophica bacterium]|nr:50S ribosomal protein L18 [Candidatus Omnitrophota bacterium]HOX54732.1 50S ribosomal protein L18 [Candidatus Omnitrophota bacterium]
MKRRTPRAIRQRRIRTRVIGTPEKPRLNIFRSLKHLSVQFIDDIEGKVLLRVSTLDKDLKDKIKYGGNIKAASILGEAVATKAKAKGISKVCFDRGGYLYHGRIRALADAARKAGLEF